MYHNAKQTNIKRTDARHDDVEKKIMTSERRNL